MRVPRRRRVGLSREGRDGQPETFITRGPAFYGALLYMQEIEHLACLAQALPVFHREETAIVNDLTRFDLLLFLLLLTAPSICICMHVTYMRISLAVPHYTVCRGRSRPYKQSLP